MSIRKSITEASVSNIIDFAIEIEKQDNRIARCQVHSGRTIAFITLCAILCGYRTWNDIADYGKYRKEFIETYVGKMESTPSHDTIARFFNRLSQKKFEGIYRFWIKEALTMRRSPMKENVSKRHIAIDGKELCGAKKDKPIRMVSAYSVQDGISLGQEEIAEKSNEIPAVQKLIEDIDVKGCVVTADAMHCQKKTCRLVIEGGGDFFFFLKSNQGTLLEAVKAAVEPARYRSRNNNDRYEETAHSNRLDWCSRECIVVGEPRALGELYHEWQGIKSFGVIITQTADRDTYERYFISSLKMDAKELLNISRNHWGVENGLHRTLDMTFDEDTSKKKENSAVNFSLAVKTAMACLALDTSCKSPKRKMTRAALDPNYLHKLLNLVADTI